jgi:hypothetical protein
MELIMAKLIVKPEYLEASVAFSRNGGSYLVVLKNATQEELEHMLKHGRLDKKDGEKGDFDHLFVSEPKKDKEK